ncbi:hypothetical protein FACS189423_07660 [Bacteroidia bacterium]|nr:hypothetical protein FACS189423_07660 [Bacteroidia bacterium]
MKVITTREVRNEMKTYFDLAEEERVLVKRGKKFVNLIITDDPDRVFLDDNWVRDFFAIPAEYRCNPFDISPSGDLFWADKRNVEQLGKAIKSAETGKKYVLKEEDQKRFFGLE